MIIKKYLIEALAHTLADGNQWAALKTLVSDIEAESMSGAEKFQKVKDDFLAIGYDIGGWVVDTLIQLAVMYVKTIVL